MSQHYQEMEIQPYQVMRANGVLDEYLWAVAIKYLMRAAKKTGGKQILDLYKAQDCINTLIKEIEKEEEVPF